MSEKTPKYDTSFECKHKTCPVYSECYKLPSVKYIEKESHKKNINILFVVGSPSSFDIQQKQMLQDDLGVTFKTIVKEAIGYKEDVTFAYTSYFRHKPSKENKGILQEAKKFCVKNLFDDIEKYNPDIIIPVGEGALKIFQSVGFVSSDRDAENNNMIKARIFLNYVSIRNKTFKILPIFSYYFALIGKNDNGEEKWKNKLGDLSVIISDIRRAIRFISPDYKPLDTSTNKFKIKYLDTVEKVTDFVDYAIKKDCTKIVCDTETKNLNRTRENKLALIQFSLDGKTAYIIPLEHPDSPFTVQEIKQVKKQLRRLFKSKKSKFKYWVFANAVFDLHQFYRALKLNPLDIKKKIFDVLLMKYALNENRVDCSKGAYPQNGSYALKPLSREFLQFRGYENEKILKAREEGELYSMPLDNPDLLKYAADDVFTPYYLVNEFFKRAERQNYRDKLLLFCERYFDRVIRLIVIIEQNGILVDMDQMRKLTNSKMSPVVAGMKEIETELKNRKSVKKANKLLLKNNKDDKIGGYGKKEKLQSPWGEDPYIFSLTKTAHLKKLFFDVLKLKPVNTGKTGDSVDKAFQERYGGEKAEDKVKEVVLFKEYQSLNTLFKMFIKPLSKMVDPETGKEDFRDGRIRPSLRMNVTNTGRLASYTPNTQQLPSGKTEVAKETKSLFVAKKGYGLVEADYAASEVRWLCNMAKDEVYADSFKQALKIHQEYRKNPTKENKIKTEIYGDPHKNSFNIMTGKPLEKIDSSDRKIAKGITFGLIYGMAIRTLAINLKKSEEETQGLVDKFFGQFKKSKKYLSDVEELAKLYGFIDSPIFRRRTFLGFRVNNFKFSSEARRLSRNSPIQGISSDSALIGAYLICKYAHEHKKDWKIINVVHDSVTAEVPENEMFEFVKIANNLLTNGVERYLKKKFGFDLVCPLFADFKLGNRLGHMKEFDWAHLDKNLEFYTRN